MVPRAKWMLMLLLKDVQVQDIYEMIFLYTVRNLRSSPMMMMSNEPPHGYGYQGLKALLLLNHIQVLSLLQFTRDKI
ncbi:hypothetical protein LWI29_019017 [Acer saccharum]|uniref:Uncharacterized protein n=1 Tax=Acer saccharum TaxID=4024 RepID=A0AA39SVW3_ACESA|nr:hypothetical protein LWI29_019017 [Acer saccharum]